MASAFDDSLLDLRGDLIFQIIVFLLPHLVKVIPPRKVVRFHVDSVLDPRLSEGGNLIEQLALPLIALDHLVVFGFPDAISCHPKTDTRGWLATVRRPARARSRSTHASRSEAVRWACKRL